MNIQLTPVAAALIQKKIDSGRYASADEVVQAAIRLLDERDRQLHQLRVKLQVGFDEIGRGETVAFTPELVAQMLRDARQMAIEGKTPDPDVCP